MRRFLGFAFALRAAFCIAALMQAAESKDALFLVLEMSLITAGVLLASWPFRIALMQAVHEGPSTFKPMHDGLLYGSQHHSKHRFDRNRWRCRISAPKTHFLGNSLFATPTSWERYCAQGYRLFRVEDSGTVRRTHDSGVQRKLRLFYSFSG